MHLPDLIADLAVMLLTAGVVTLIFKKINQPTVLGYILAGFLISPYMPFFFNVVDKASVDTWSEIGIIILMFSLGLEFNLHKLAEVGVTGIITAMTEILGMLVLGYCVGQLMGWSAMDSVFLGGMLSMSSTTIIIKAFDELGVRKESFASLVFGTLVIEDIAGIFMMIILSTVSVSQNISGLALAGKLGMLVLYLALWLIFGIYLLPTFLSKASGIINDENLLLVSLGLCFAMVLLADALGFSSALGAFLAGSLIAGTVHAERVEHLISPVKDLFGAVFFLSVGMMIDPSMIVKYIVPILIISVVAVIGKLFFSSLGVLFSGNSLKNAIHCGCSLAQIGEFAFIIASLGLSLGVIADYIYPVIVSVSVITTLTTPFFIKNGDKIHSLVVNILPAKAAEKLDSLDNASSKSTTQESDWAAFIGRYVKVTLLYSVIMAGIGILGQSLLYPLLLKVGLGSTLSASISLAVIFFAIAVFVKPMLDTKYSEYTTLWMKSDVNRLPLMALSAIRIILISIFAYAPLEVLTGASGIWIIVLIALLVFLVSKSGFFASRFLYVEAKFLANFNERRLLDYAGGEKTGDWLDSKLFVLSFVYDGSESDLDSLSWGKSFGVNVIKITRSVHKASEDADILIPAASDIVRNGDSVYIIGDEDAIKSMKAGLKLTADAVPTLKEFIASQVSEESYLYDFALIIDKDSPFNAKTIKNSSLRENYDCIILGLQRDNLPIAHPDINTELSSGDIVWILGTNEMAGRVLATES